MEVAESCSKAFDRLGFQVEIQLLKRIPAEFVKGVDQIQATDRLREDAP